MVGDALRVPGRRKALVVCGPTAAGKSDLADALAESLSETSETRVPTIVVDSMQVYREIPVMTNQHRARPAELVGIVSVAEEWTVARHKQKAERVIGSLSAGAPFVLDAGTGMYLNALVLDVPLAPKVPGPVRAEARKLASGTENPRREARRWELKLVGARERGSIWDGPPRYDATFLYLRPERDELDRNIRARSSKIAQGGLEEAKRLEESGVAPNPSVREAVGVKEMLLCASGHLTIEEAEQAIATRTRRLARRQMRWFDKLARSLPETTRVLVVEDAHNPEIKHLMHDTIRS